MNCDPNRKFVKVNHVGENSLINQMESSLKTYLDWGLLSIGGWTNIETPTSGAFGGDFSTLRAVSDPAYTDGQVWESARKDWVWETGMDYSGVLSNGDPTGVEPIAITGVSVGGTTYGTGDATYAHHYNYPLGRVIFDTAVSTTSAVKLDYSYRNVQTYIADQAPWWDEIQQNSLRVDDSTFDQIGSGNWGILSNHRVQLPAVVVEAVPRRTFTPYQLGDVSQFVYQDVLFHIIADTRWWRNNLVDIVSLQKDTTIMMYNNNTVAQSGAYPLDYRGMLVDSSKSYPCLADEYPFKTMRFFNVIVTEMQTLNSRLYQGTVRVTFELVN
ncbi:MAG: hypothetical protein ACYTE5_00210 [Planctomycetota bacterium]|jgi:hypothetical protein